ncbi:MAG: hypothetical protein HY663_00590 [Chloroflexi bacterium]|nr:hypothetical protein [Chloroflexota bacterium]
MDPRRGMQKLLALTNDEYRHGIVWWTANTPEGTLIILGIGTADSPAGGSSWSYPLTDPEGSLVSAQPHRFVQLRVELKTAISSCTPALRAVHFERDTLSFLWPGVSGYFGTPPIVLTAGRSLGCSHRIVVPIEKADWQLKRPVLISRDLRVRFVSGKIRLTHVSGFTDGKFDDNGHFSVEGTVEDVEGNGRFVEIITSMPANDETSKLEARERCFSVLGLLALTAGEQILGQRLYEESFSYNGQQGCEEGVVPIPIRSVVPRMISEDEILEFTSAVVPHDQHYRTSLNLALRWYHIGLTSQSTIEALLAFFVAVEVVVSTFSRLTLGKIETELSKRINEFLKHAKPRPSKEILHFIRESIAEVPLQIRFDTYRSRSGIADQRNVLAKFGELKRLRNDIAHGRRTAVEEAQAYAARELLEAILRHELGITSNPAKEWPRVFSAAIRYRLVRS